MASLLGLIRDQDKLDQGLQKKKNNWENDKLLDERASKNILAKVDALSTYFPIDPVLEAKMLLDELEANGSEHPPRAQ
jgi:hypothetical protein